jgi:hypothetical protein
MSTTATLSTTQVLLAKEENREEQEIPSSSSSTFGWTEAFLPLLLVLVAHLALGFVTELFHHRGAHVGLRE